MDEPFGAVDPITRGLLQDELMRLQSDLGKTIVFVTHDFNEAVKLGDRIAVLGNQSHIMQYDTPEAILAHPANDMVAGFVGADASLKQLTLTRVAEVELLDCPTAYEDGSVDDLRAAISSRRIKWGRPPGRAGPPDPLGVVAASGQRHLAARHRRPDRGGGVHPIDAAGRPRGAPRGEQCVDDRHRPAGASTAA